MTGMTPSIDITELRLTVMGRPITAVTKELFENYSSGDLEELKEDLEEAFAPGGDWCLVGAEAHTTRGGDGELRLRPRTGAPGWHADFFHAGWRQSRFEDVPQEHRPAVAAYVDRHHELRANMLTVEQLRRACSEGGLPAVNALVLELLTLFDERLRTIDTLQNTLTITERQQPWASQLLREECQQLLADREWAQSAFMEFHLGTAGIRPEVILAFGFGLPSGWVALFSDPATLNEHTGGDGPLLND